MIKNYAKIAFRNLLKFKTFSFINIAGLTVGLTSTILIVLFVLDELSFDKFHLNSDRIYRVTREWLNQDGESNLHLARIAPPIGPLLKNDFPGIIEEMTRVLQDYNTLLKVGDRNDVEERFFWAEQNFFKIFTYDFLKGNPASALSEPNAVVLTESTAKRLFGSIDIIGRTINYERDRDLKITGIIRNAPENSHFKFDFLASFITLNDIIGTELLTRNWGRNNYLTYILIPKNFPIESLKEKIPAFLDNHLTDLVVAETGSPPQEKPSKFNLLHFQKLTDIHLRSHLVTELEENGDIVNIYLFSVIAILILMIACINFMNLSTARSAKRTKEIGMRKVLGAYRDQLIMQFIGESVLISVIAGVLAVMMVELLLPWFGNFVGKKLSLNLFSDFNIVLFLLCITVFVGFVSGSYPALLLSSFKPVSIFKGNRTSSRNSTFRTILVIAQFIVSIALIICMGIVQSQVSFYKNKKLGYNKENIIVLPASRDMLLRLDEIKSELMENRQIKKIGSSRLIPTNNLINNWGGELYNDDKPVRLAFRLAAQEVDYDFFETYEIPLVSGRYFNREYGTDDSAAFILNESAVKKMGFKPEQILNKEMKYGPRKGRIIGVVKDFNFESLHNEIAPIIFLITNDGNYQIAVKISGENIPGTIDFLKTKWEQYQPEYPFQYSFLDDEFDKLYKSEERLREVFGLFSILAVIIACLGLFGLASFTAEVRTKEIGIRKTLGASAVGIVFLFSKEFLKLILIANLIAWPLSYFVMKRWLEDFAYKTSIAFSIFILAGVSAALIALFTISFQALKAAAANPVKSLKYE